MKSLIRNSTICLLLACPGIFASDSPAGTEDKAQLVQSNLDILWTCLGAFLVFFMQAGFAMVEAGFTRAKNAVNIIMKNLMDFSIGSLAFFLVGFGLMFGVSKGIIGHTGFAGSGIDSQFSFSWSFLIFQTVFCATAATIVSGAVSERTKFVSYLIYSVIISLVIYPIFGKWAWGSLYLGDAGAGWLEKLGFMDFAGSTVVHSIGGWLALAGAIILGPRIGKYDSLGNPKAIPGHNLPLAALGVFVLWFGWFGCNPGRTTAANGSIGYIAMTTNLAASAGCVVALITAWFIVKKPDASMALNGTLAGLVAVTAPCNAISPLAAIIIGSVAGALVVFSVLFIDRVLKVDDPVGAVSVHGVCGTWGTISCGLFNLDNGLFYGGGFKALGVQLLGASTAFAWAFGLGLIMFFVIKKTIGMRVTPDDELKGLDVGEHGMEAYAGFQIFSTL